MYGMVLHIASIYYKLSLNIGIIIFALTNQLINGPCIVCVSNLKGSLLVH